MNYNLADLINLPRLSKVLESFYNATGVAVGLRDSNDDNLFYTEKNICTCFYGENDAATKLKCFENDRQAKEQLLLNKEYCFYKCAHNLNKVIAPIIVEGEYLGSIFQGPFFYEEEERKDFVEDQELFPTEKDLFLEALAGIPVLSPQKVEKHVALLCDLAEMIAEIGLANLRHLELKKKLELSEERLRLALEGSCDGIWDWNIFTDELTYSLSLGEIMGFSNLEMPAHFDEWRKRIHPEDKRLLKADFVDHIAGKRDRLDCEYRIMCQDGIYRWFLSKGKITSTDSAGNPLRIVGTITDITERKKREEEILYLSYHDKLTGLHNRAYFEQELERLDREGELPISVIIGDVNGLKLANDVFGHREGDELLQRIAKILLRSVRKEDLVARWGGDEFAIILPRTDEETALAICKKIKEACNAEDRGFIQPSIALGCSAKDDDKKSLGTLLQEAEDWMYRHKLLENRSVRSDVIAFLEKTLFESSFETREHAQRLVLLSRLVGIEIGLSDNEMEQLNLLSRLHDIGKIAISDNILMKPGKLNPEEWEEMRRHSEIGYRIAESSKDLSHISEFILHHHERWDGNGYPEGIKGEAIPLLARIVTLVDAYDVMTNVRPYKEAMTHEAALEEIKRCAGTQFDPEIAQILIDLFA